MLGNGLFKYAWLEGGSSSLPMVGWQWCNITYGEMSTLTSSQLKMFGLGSTRTCQLGVLWEIQAIVGNAQLTRSRRCHAMNRLFEWHGTLEWNNNMTLILLYKRLNLDLLISILSLKFQKHKIYQLLRDLVGNIKTNSLIENIRIRFSYFFLISRVFRG